MTSISAPTLRKTGHLHRWGLFCLLSGFPACSPSWQDASDESLDILTFFTVNFRQPEAQTPSPTVWVLGTWEQEGIQGPCFSQEVLPAWIQLLYFNIATSRTKMNIKLAESLLFPSSPSSPWATKLPNGAVCTLSFPMVPLKEQWSFFPDAPPSATGKGWWSKEARRAGAALGSGWGAGWWEYPGSCPLRCCEGMWTAAREIQRHSPHNWLFSCIWARADNHCFLLLPLRVRAREIWGRDAAFRGWR